MSSLDSFPSLFGLFQNLTYLGMYMFIPHYAIDTQIKHQYIRYQLIIFINICLRNPHTPRTNHSLYEFFRLQRLSHCFFVFTFFTWQLYPHMWKTHACTDSFGILKSWKGFLRLGLIHYARWTVMNVNFPCGCIVLYRSSLCCIVLCRLVLYCYILYCISNDTDMIYDFVDHLQS